ncbi:M48 family metallopeptidase [Microlunatus flavus]|uniref:Zn-dependent protease with chaperone function n=1 Tax=Microlunatus flavus TaxID=1036181 RepID=A0A1H9AX34_9ACTN|nr:M48 family metallopeptidase [Microlunatus flavus]SEP81179.1 Zn-dependent protease with chaperone function [Microlunatus flavus]
MSYASERTLRPGRMRFPDISPRAYEHPADRGAVVALRALPGFDTVLRAVSGVVGERSVRLLYLATSIRTSVRQYPELHAIVAECATTLDLHPVPELFVTMNPVPEAVTIGLDRPVIVLSTGMLQMVDAEGLRFVVGHEVGHVLSGHAIYRTLLLQLLSLSQSVSWLPVGSWGLRVIVLALGEWFRKSELSADRAGLLCTQDPTTALRVHAAMAGALDPDDMDVAGFLDQAKDYQASRDVRDSVLRLLQVTGSTHPLAALRAAELQQWAAGPEYRAILAGDYLRRSDEAGAPIAEDVREAAASYSTAFTSSSDPLVGLVGRIGGLAGSVGGAAASRVRSWWQSGRAPGEAGDADGPEDGRA